jgi:chromosome partitioning protein
MNVITVASRKGGAGKTTICAHLAAHAHAQGHRSLIIDADPQGSLSLCNAMRPRALPLMTAERGIDRALALALVDGIEWVFIDTAPTMWVVVQEAVRAATLVLIPARPGFLDLAAVRETVKCARERDKPYAVVLNACPVKRGQKEAPAVAHSRAWLEKNRIPVWSGQISQRAGFVQSLSHGVSAAEDNARSLGAAEVAKLWTAVEKSVEAVNAARAPAAAGMQGRAA